MVDEHRIAPRRRFLKAGRISFGGGAAIDCTIRNLSETGAAPAQPNLTDPDLTDHGGPGLIRRDRTHRQMIAPHRLKRQCLDSRLTITPVGSGSCGDSFVSVSSLQ